MLYVSTEIKLHTNRAGWKIHNFPQEYTLVFKTTISKKKKK